MTRADRRWRTIKKVISRMKDAEAFGPLKTIKEENFVEKVKGRSKKQHPLDCGNPQCGLCSRDKVYGIKGHHDIVAEERAKKEIKEFFEN